MGIIYGLVVEGLLTNFGASIAPLQTIARLFLRTNGYSLVAPLRDIVLVEVDGPGTFAGPFVAPWQALAVLVAYLIVFSGVAALLLARRDVA